MKNSKIKNLLLKNYFLSYLIIIPSFFISIILVSLISVTMNENLYKILGITEVDNNSLFYIIAIFTLIVDGILLFFYAKYTSNKFIKPIEHIVHVLNHFNDGDKDIRMSNITNNEFSVITATFNTMANTIQETEIKKDQLLENKRQLMGDIVHDLKTPISSIKGYSEILISDKLNQDKINKYLNIINKNSIRLNELIEDLNQYSNLDLNSNIYEKNNIDIVNWFRNLVIEYYEIFITNKFHLNVDIPEITINYLFDGRLLKRAFSNIFENTIKYNPPGTIVHIKFTVNHNYISINIRDNGIGIPLEYKEKIFEPFFRIDKSRNSKSKGSGLGLAITNKIINDHHGKIYLEKKYSNGTSFIIRLPL